VQEQIDAPVPPAVPPVVPPVVPPPPAGHPTRNIGIASDIWSLGAVLYVLMCRELLSEYVENPAAPLPGAPIPPGAVAGWFWQKSFTVNNLVSHPAGPFRTYGKRLWERARPLYSWTLIELAYRCLAHLPATRITASQLNQESSAVVAAYERSNPATVSPRVFNDAGGEPVKLQLPTPEMIIYEPNNPLAPEARGTGPAGPPRGFDPPIPNPAELPGMFWHVSDDPQTFPLPWKDNLPSHSSWVYSDFPEGEAIPPAPPAPPPPPVIPPPLPAVAPPAPGAFPAPVVPVPADAVVFGPPLPPRGWVQSKILTGPWRGGQRRRNAPIRYHPEPF